MNSSLSLALRNIFFALLMPGNVTGVIPYFLTMNQAVVLVAGSNQWIGAMLFLPGITILILCIARFATEGKGTLAPIDPTRRLVISGVYQFSRNPMYVGVMLMLTGETVFFWSRTLLVYSSFAFLFFNLFIMFFEEPRLTRDFGDEYREYRRRVRRWL